MTYIRKKDTDGSKPLLLEGELGYDKFVAGADVGRVYVGTGTSNLPLAQKSETDAAAGRLDIIEPKLATIEPNAKDDQSAFEVPYSNTTSGLLATDLQGAVDEVEGRLDTAETKLGTIETNAKDDQLASEVPVVPAGGVSSTDVQAALEELDSEKFDKTGGTVSGDVTVSGNLTVNGSTVQVNSEVVAADTLITLNAGEVGAGVTAGFSGVEVDRGTLPNYSFGFDELSDSFVLGEAGSTKQPVATREDTPKDGKWAYWSSAQKRFLTKDVDWTDLQNVPDINRTATQSANGLMSSTDKTKLDGIEAGAQVNTITSVNSRTGAVTGLVENSDLRLSNSREWTASTVSQAEAEAGTATTRRAWTAQRVRQAVAAWWQGVTSSLGRTLVGRSTAAQMRSDLGLGTAATKNVATNAQALSGTANVLPDAAGVRAVIAQDAPSKTGTNASGTWGINISGNAASATKLQTAGYVVEYNATTKSLDFNFVG